MYGVWSSSYSTNSVIHYILYYYMYTKIDNQNNIHIRDE